MVRHEVQLPCLDSFLHFGFHKAILSVIAPSSFRLLVSAASFRRLLHSGRKSMLSNWFHGKWDTFLLLGEQK